MREALRVALAALFAAALLHHALSHLSGDLPRWLARRRGSPDRSRAALRSAIAFGTLALEAALWRRRSPTRASACPPPRARAT
jgi:hypothetical protein